MCCFHNYHTHTLIFFLCDISFTFPLFASTGPNGGIGYSDGWIGGFYAYNVAMESVNYVGYDALTPVATNKLLHINYPHKGIFLTSLSAFGGQWTGVIGITTDGLYSFRVSSDDGS